MYLIFIFSCRRHPLNVTATCPTRLHIWRKQEATSLYSLQVSQAIFNLTLNLHGLIFYYCHHKALVWPKMYFALVCVKCLKLPWYSHLSFNKKGILFVINGLIVSWSLLQDGQNGDYVFDFLGNPSYRNKIILEISYFLSFLKSSFVIYLITSLDISHIPKPSCFPCFIVWLLCFQYYAAMTYQG